MKTRACEFPCDNEALHHGSFWIQEEHGKALVNLLAPEPSVVLAVDVAPFAVPDSSDEMLDLTPVTSMVGVCDEIVEAADEIDMPKELVEASEPMRAIVEHRPSGIQLRNEAEALEPEDDISVEDLAFDALVFSPDEVAGAIEAVAEGPAEGEVAALAKALAEPVAEGLAEDAHLETAELSAAFFERIRMVVRSSGGDTAVEALDRTLAKPDDSLAQRLDAWKKVLDFEGDDLSACGGQTLDEFAATLAATALGTPERHPELRKSLRAIGIAAFGLLDAA